MRIAIGGTAHETNTFSTVPTKFKDFYRTEGADLIAGRKWHELQQEDVDIVPLFSAHAMPSGKVTKDAFERLLLNLLSGLRQATPLDGVLLTLHGAMEVEEIGDGETAVLHAVRAEFGDELFITVTLDLHANLAPEVVGMSQIITAYRTAPHRDAEETNLRGMTLMIECIRQRRKPVSRMVKLPLLVPGEAAVTEAEPAKTLYEHLTEIDRRPGVLVSSILIGCAWTDSPHTSVAAVVSGTDEVGVTETAGELATQLWERREEFTIDSVTSDIPGAISLACESAKKPVFISDSGDNTTAGAAGDTPVILEYLLAHGAKDALVAGITDARAVQACMRAGVGSEVEVAIGGKLDTEHARPSNCRGTVRAIKTSEELGVEFGTGVVFRVDAVDVVLQEDRTPFTELSHFSMMGLDPADYKIIVVKEGYLFPELRDYAPHHIMALSPGFADLCLERLPFRRLRRPVYPLDPKVEWKGW